MSVLNIMDDDSAAVTQTTINGVVYDIPEWLDCDHSAARDTQPPLEAESSRPL